MESTHNFFTYAGLLGFIARQGLLIKVELELRMKFFFCSKERILRKKKDKYLVIAHMPISKQHDIQMDCNAQVTFRLDQEKSKWKVHFFVEEHSHALVTPSNWHLHNVNRHITPTSHELLELLMSHIPPSQQYLYFAMNSRGY